MRDATLPEVRALARRSRATQRAGLLALVIALLAAPIALAWGEWAGAAAVVAAGALTIVWARLAGQERGAYRALLRTLKARDA
jgi:hypothetical protein